MEYRHLTNIPKNKFNNNGQDNLQMRLATYLKALVDV